MLSAPYLFMLSVIIPALLVALVCAASAYFTERKTAWRAWPLALGVFLFTFIVVLLGWRFWPGVR